MANANDADRTLMTPIGRYRSGQRPPMVYSYTQGTVDPLTVFGGDTGDSAYCGDAWNAANPLGSGAKWCTNGRYVILPSGRRGGRSDLENPSSHGGSPEVINTECYGCKLSPFVVSSAPMFSTYSLPLPPQRKYLSRLASSCRVRFSRALPQHEPHPSCYSRTRWRCAWRRGTPFTRRGPARNGPAPDSLFARALRARPAA